MANQVAGFLLGMLLCVCLVFVGIAVQDVAKAVREQNEILRNHRAWYAERRARMRRES